MRPYEGKSFTVKLPIPTVDKELEGLNGSTVFSKLDMNMGFHQIELEEGSRDITTFSEVELWYYSAPEPYQNIVRQILAGFPGATNTADDIEVHGKTTEDHDRNLVALLTDCKRETSPSIRISARLE